MDPLLCILEALERASAALHKADDLIQDHGHLPALAQVLDDNEVGWDVATNVTLDIDGALGMVGSARGIMRRIVILDTQPSPSAHPARKPARGSLDRMPQVRDFITALVAESPEIGPTQVRRALESRFDPERQWIPGLSVIGYHIRQVKEGIVKPAPSTQPAA